MMNQVRLQIRVWIACGLFMFVPLIASAEGTLSLLPNLGTYRVYDDVTVRVVASSQGESVRAVSARLSFNPNDITITHVTVDDSIISSWMEKPTVNQELGEIRFEGWLATSTILDRSTVLTIRFRPERVGESLLRFETGEIVAHDATGSNILTGFISGRYRISPEDNIQVNQEEVVFAESNVLVGEVLGETTQSSSRITLTSPTHLSEEGWYSATSAVMYIAAHPDATDLWLGLSKNTHASPSIAYGEVLKEKVISEIEEGVMYFHAEVTDPTGRTTGKYRLQTDRTPPVVERIAEIFREDASDPNISLEVVASDTLSGISKYEVSVGSAPPIVIPHDGSGKILVRIPAQGEHVLHVAVLDRAGNRASELVRVLVDHLPAPVLSLQSKQLFEGRKARIDITATPHAQLSVSIAREGGESVVESAQVDRSGTIQYATPTFFTPGIYYVAVVVTDERGAVSLPAEPLMLTVEPTWWGVITRHPGIPLLGFLALIFGYAVLRVLRGVPTADFVSNEERLHSESNPIPDVVEHEEYRAHQVDLR
jgi:hypothetical protein